MRLSNSYVRTEVEKRKELSLFLFEIGIVNNNLPRLDYV